MKGFVDIWIDALYPYTFKIGEDSRVGSSQNHHDNLLIVPANGRALRIGDFCAHNLNLSGKRVYSDRKILQEHSRIWDDANLRGTEVPLEIRRRAGTLSDFFRSNERYSIEGYSHSIFTFNYRDIELAVVDARNCFMNSINNLVGEECDSSAIKLLAYFVSPN